MKNTLYSLLFLSLIWSCDSKELALACDTSGDIVHKADNWAGRIGFMEDYKAYTVNYHVPGTIDSKYTGVICDNLADEFRVDGLEVSFSGNFIDDQSKIQPLLVTGGQEFFFFELTKINTINKVD